MSWAELFEVASYIVTVVGLPFAIAAFLVEQRKQRENEEEAAYQQLSDAYNDFLKLVLANPDLHLRTKTPTAQLSDEQRERMLVIFEMLVSLFERAHILLFEPRMSTKQARRWHSWEDYMREWCRREDFRVLLPQLLAGEDGEFADFIRRVAVEEGAALA